MNEGERPRRRLNAPGPRRTGPKTDPWVLTVIAAIVVVAGGWFLGQGLAHIFSPQGEQAAPVRTQSPLAAATSAPSPSEIPTSVPTATPGVRKIAKPAPKITHNPVRKVAAAPRSSASARPTQEPSAPATAAPTPTAVATSKPVATPTPKPEPKTTLKPAVRTAAPKPAQTPPPASASEDIASSTVRSYIGALKRGDPQGAAALLGNGEPDEAFIDQNTRITGLASTRNSDGSYKVGVSMQTAKGSYYETFIVAPSGTSARILEKNASKNP